MHLGERRKQAQARLRVRVLKAARAEGAKGCAASGARRLRRRRRGGDIAQKRPSPVVAPRLPQQPEQLQLCRVDGLRWNVSSLGQSIVSPRSSLHSNAISQSFAAKM